MTLKESGGMAWMWNASRLLSKTERIKGTLHMAEASLFGKYYFT